MSLGLRWCTGEATVNTGSWANSSEKRSDEEESSSTEKKGVKKKAEAISGEALSSRHNDNDLRSRLSAAEEDIAP